MQTSEHRTFDKSDWGPGPWQSEPDKRQWRDDKTGLPCLIVRGPTGALCGYVGVARGHPAYETDYDSVDVEVHGGLTFAAKCAPEPTRDSWEQWRARIFAQADEARRYPEGDAARSLRDRQQELHDFDAFARWHEASHICHRVEPGEDDDVWWLGFDCVHLGDWSPAFDRPGRYDGMSTYKTIAFVTSEIERLAQQLSEQTASQSNGGADV